MMTGDMAAYIKDLALQLAAMASKEHPALLAYSLRLAAAEAEKIEKAWRMRIAAD